jgi:hypothetical protein
MGASTGIAGTAVSLGTVLYVFETASDEVVDVVEYEAAMSSSELLVSSLIVDCDL